MRIIVFLFGLIIMYGCNSPIKPVSGVWVETDGNRVYVLNSDKKGYLLKRNQKFGADSIGIKSWMIAGDTLKIERIITKGGVYSGKLNSIVDKHIIKSWNNDEMIFDYGHTQSVFVNNPDILKELKLAKTKTEEKPKQPVSINGTYLYSDNSAKVEITIVGSAWQCKIMMISGFGSAYDERNAIYEKGVIKENKLFDASGKASTGYVKGNSLYTALGGQKITLRK